MRIALALLCRSAWAYTDSCGYTATYWDDAASDFTVAASEVVAYDGSGCDAGFSYFYCEEGAGASCGGGDSTDGFDCARRARPISPCPPPPARPLSPERVPSFDPSERAAADCQNNWACPCNLVHSAACCYCSCCIASAAGATVEPTGVATPALTGSLHALAQGPDHALCFDTCDLVDGGLVGGMDATLHGTATCVPETGLVCDGSDGGYADLNDVELGGAMTIEAWARWDELGFSYSRIFDFGDPHGMHNIRLGQYAGTSAINVRVQIHRLGPLQAALRMDQRRRVP